MSERPGVRGDTISFMTKECNHIVAMYRIISQLTPNNQLKITKLSKWNPGKRGDGVPQQREGSLASRLDNAVIYRRIEKALDSLDKVDAYDEWLGDICPHITIYDPFEDKSTLVPIYRVIDDVERYEAILDIQLESQSATSGKHSWGQPRPSSRFSRGGRHKILEAGGAVDLEGRKDECWLVTVTIPGGGREVYDAVARWSGYIANQMTQQLRNWDRGRASKDERGYFYVWELQKRGALHMHWCLIGYPPEMATAIKDSWYRCMGDISEKEGIDLFESAHGYSWRDRPDVWKWDIQKVQKGVGGYFAKYASKDAVSAKRPDNRGFGEPGYTTSPGRWYSISYSVRAWMRKHTVSLDLVVFDEAELSRCIHALHGCVTSLEKFASMQYEFSVTSETSKPYCVGQVDSYLFPPDDYSLVYARMSSVRERFYDSVLREKLSGLFGQ